MEFQSHSSPQQNPQQNGQENKLEQNPKAKVLEAVYEAFEMRVLKREKPTTFSIEGRDYKIETEAQAKFADAQVILKIAEEELARIRATHYETQKEAYMTEQAMLPLVIRAQSALETARIDASIAQISPNVAGKLEKGFGSPSTDLDKKYTVH